MRFLFWENKITSGVPPFWVEFPLLGDRVELADGSVVPTEWMVFDDTGPAGAPLYVIECAIGEDLVPRVVAVLVQAQRGGREVKAVDLRRIRPLEDILEQSFLMVAKRQSIVVDEPVPVEPHDLVAERDQRRRELKGLRLQERRRFTDEMAREVARIYVDNLASGAPTKAVREHFGIAESTASLYVRRARALIDELRQGRGDG